MGERKWIKIEKIFRDLCEIEENEALEDNIFEALSCLPSVQEGLVDSMLWWEIFENVVKYKEFFISYPYARATGDLTLHELGWEGPSLDDIRLVELHETVRVSYY